jgi:hypothetical protein
LTQTSLQSLQEQSKTLTCSLSGIGSLTLIFLKKSVLKRKAEKLDALIGAVNCLNNGEVKIAEAEEEMSGNGGETDEDVDGEDPGLE